MIGVVCNALVQENAEAENNNSILCSIEAEKKIKSCVYTFQ